MSQASFHLRGGTWALSRRSAGGAVSSGVRDFPRGTVGPGPDNEGTAARQYSIFARLLAGRVGDVTILDDNRFGHMYSDGRYPRSIGLTERLNSVGAR